MCSCTHVLLLAALPALTGWGSAEVVQLVPAAHKPLGSLGPSEPSGPRLPDGQSTTVVGVRGDSATLRCQVTHLGDKAVSWVRTSDLQILTFGATVFTSDARVTLAVEDEGATASRHALTIARLRTSDAGRYECQLNTEPKTSLRFQLTVLDERPPRLIVTLRGAERAVPLGASVTLKCEAHYEPRKGASGAPQPAAALRWRKDGRPLDLQGSSGGVALETDRWGSSASSQLTLGAVREGDAGRYECGSSDATDATDAHVVLRVLDDFGGAEAMQRDQSLVASEARPLPLRWLVSVLAMAGLLRTCYPP